MTVFFLFFSSSARPSAGSNHTDHWSLSHSQVEHIASSPNGIHGNHLYASIPGYDLDQPLALTKSSHNTGIIKIQKAVVGDTVERPQVFELYLRISI